jgi:hypothetical protein
MSQPFTTAQVFTGFEGRYVSLADTIRSFTEILDGKHDGLPEAAFYMVGDIDEVQRKVPFSPLLTYRPPTSQRTLNKCEEIKGGFISNIFY